MKHTPPPINAPHDELDDTRLSKTRQKRAMEALQSLGEALVALSTHQLATIELPDDLREAIRAARQMTRQDEARRRQMQYIGKLMRRIDPEPLRQALADATGASASEVARLHRLERWRESLLADEKVLQEIADAYPLADLQHLRSLRRSALKERAESRPPKSFRTLFQVLKALHATEENTKASDAELGNAIE